MVEYQVRWVGYARATWEPEANILDPALLSEYHNVSARKTLEIHRRRSTCSIYRFFLA